jgi:hypothetical protein
VNATFTAIIGSFNHEVGLVENFFIQNLSTKKLLKIFLFEIASKNVIYFLEELKNLSWIQILI